MVKIAVNHGANHCYLNMDADGNITLDSTTSITLKSDIFKVECDT